MGDRSTVSAEQQIRDVLARWADATSTGAQDRVLANHAHDVVIYDVLPPMRYRGAEAYRRSWEEWQPRTEGEMTFELHDVEVVAGPEVAFAYGLLHCAGSTPGGGSFEDWVRATFCLQKRGERWLVSHQHMSMPRT